MAIAMLAMIVIYVIYTQTTAMNSTLAASLGRNSMNIPVSHGGAHLYDTGLAAYGMGGRGRAGLHHDPLKAAAKYGSYYYNPNAQEMYSGSGSALVQAPASTPKTSAQWIAANAAARAASQPRTSLHSQFEAPIVSSLDPHRMEMNPLDPFLDNILFQVSTFRNRRNANFDLRGQAPIDDDFLVGTDQLVNPRSTARLSQHGIYHQITSCSEPKAPRY